MQDLGWRVSGFGFRVSGLGFRDQDAAGERSAAGGRRELHERSWLQVLRHTSLHTALHTVTYALHTYMGAGADGTGLHGRQGLLQFKRYIPQEGEESLNYFFHCRC